MPSFTFTTENGEIQSSEELKGKTVLLVFFATWCPPCLKELPHIQKKIWGKYGHQKKFQLLVIGCEHTRQDLQKFKSKNEFTFPIIADTNRSIFSVFALQNIPRSYLINKEGKIIIITEGFNPSTFGDMIKKLEEELMPNF